MPSAYPRLRLVVDLALVLLGSALIVVAALNQPYNQNEYAQMGGYGDPDLRDAVTATRQPPLDPFLGVLAQRLLGEGHLEQRVAPVVAGILTLALTALLLRRSGLGWAGSAGLLLLATAPLFLRYSGYTRPYAVPLALMLACAVVGSTWLDTGRRRWLLAAFTTALLLPLARVPEPATFLATASLLLVVAGARERLPRGRAWGLAAVLLLGLLTAGVAAVVQLVAQGSTSQGTSFLDLAPSAVLDRVVPAATTVVDRIAPMYALWFPWWPLVLLVLGLALALPSARRHLLGSWYWLPLLLGTVAFLLAFQLLVPLGVRDYRIRYAYFLVPPLAIAVAAVVHALAQRRRIGPWVGVLLTAALVVTQAPATWQVLTRDQAVDLAGAGRVIDDVVPDGAVVVYDGPGAVGRWRQPFFGEERFLEGDHTIVTARELSRGQLTVDAKDGPTYLLVADAACISNVECTDRPADVWDGRLAGYEEVGRLEHLVLYAPRDPVPGLTGLLTAMTALVDGYGPRWGVPDAIVAARVLERRGRPVTATHLLRSTCTAQPTLELRAACAREIGKRRLGELLAPTGAGGVVSVTRVRRSPASRPDR